MIGIDDRYEGSIWECEYNRYQNRLGNRLFSDKPGQKKLKIYQAALNIVEYFHDMSYDKETGADEFGGEIKKCFIGIVDNFCIINYILAISFDKIIHRVKKDEINYLEPGKVLFQKIGREHYDGMVSLVRGIKEIEQENPNLEILLAAEARILLFVLWLMDEKMESAWRNIVLRGER